MDYEKYYQDNYNQPSVCNPSTCNHPDEHESEMRREIALKVSHAREYDRENDYDAVSDEWRLAFELENELRRHQYQRSEHLLNKYKELSRLQKQLSEVDAKMVRSLFE